MAGIPDDVRELRKRRHAEYTGREERKDVAVIPSPDVGWAMSREDAEAIARLMDEDNIPPPQPAYFSRLIDPPMMPTVAVGKQKLECHNCRRGEDMFVSFFCSKCKTLVLKTLRAINMHGTRCSNAKCGEMNRIRVVRCHIEACRVEVMLHGR